MNHDLYANREARLDTVVGDSKTYWVILGRIAEELKSDRMLDHDWVRYCEEHYGFRPLYSDDGGIIGYPKIIDDQKYLLCVLKYGG